MNRRKYCFVAMPFMPELKSFFLYLQQYLEKNYGLFVERGDASVLTRPIIDKIMEQLLRADLVIGDITGGNPNVFYEPGMAHASGKPIVFLTQESPENAPVDVRQFEFIHYNLSRHEDLLSRLDNAVQNVFGARYETLFEKAREFLRRFNADTGMQRQARTAEEFQTVVMRGERTAGIPSVEEDDRLAQFLLPKIIADFTEPAVIQRYSEWTATQASGEDNQDKER